MPILLAGLLVSSCSCAPKRVSHSMFNDYFDTYAEMVDALNECQNRHEEKEIFIFKVPFDYGYKSSYGINWVCHCGHQKHHIDKDICLNLQNHIPFYLLYNSTTPTQMHETKNCCFMRYLEKKTYDHHSLSWKRYSLVEQEYTTNVFILVDKFEIKIVNIECCSGFTYSD